MLEITDDLDRLSGNRLVGPFFARRSSLDGFEIVDANGIVAIWVYGEDIAATVVRLLNFAYEHDELR